MTGQPQLMGVDLTDPDNFVPGVPHETFTRLRQDDPVHWHPEPDGPGFWAVTRYDDVVEANRDWETYSSERGAVHLWDLDPEALAQMIHIMLYMDPPRHTRHRLLVNKGFTPRMIGRLHEHIVELATGIVDEVIERGECDFVTDVAAELPLQVIAEMMGVPHEDRALVFDWSNRMVGSEDPEYAADPSEAQSAQAELFAYANDLAAEKRKHPGDDIVSTLLQADVDGDRMSELDFDLFFMLLAVAGNETTRNLISNGLLALFDHPDQRRKLVEDPALLDSGVEEMLRWGSVVMHFRRTATRDVVLREHEIREGDKVVLWYISANRDEDVFDDPFAFRVDRSPNDHIAFGGGGPHFCLGANLARAEIKVIFDEVLRRMPDIEPAGPIQRLRSNFINGIKHIPVRFTPGRRALTS
ncbi:MAG: cytochrome P450 [Actinomycetota bacterium]